MNTILVEAVLLSAFVAAGLSSAFGVPASVDCEAEAWGAFGSSKSDSDEASVVSSLPVKKWIK